MKDIIENFEDAAEQRFYKMTEGLPEGKFRCDCGNIDDLGNANTVSVNPYSAIICGKCFEEMLNNETNR